MGKITGKPGPDPKTDLERVVVPTPFRKGGHSGKPLEEIAKKEAEQIEEWMNKITKQ
jgi:hypothetical protein